MLFIRGLGHLIILTGFDTAFMNEPKLIIIIGMLKVETAWLSATAAAMWVYVCVYAYTYPSLVMTDYCIRISTRIMLL